MLSFINYLAKTFLKSTAINYYSKHFSMSEAILATKNHEFSLSLSKLKKMLSRLEIMFSAKCFKNKSMNVKEINVICN